MSNKPCALCGYYFFTSVSWRSLYLDILDFVEHAIELDIDTETLNCLIAREQEITC